MSRLHFMVALGTALWFLAFSTVLAADDPPSAEKKPKQSAAKRTPPSSWDPFKPDDRHAKKPHAFSARKLHYSVGETAIEQALAKPTELDFTETPLNDVVAYLKDKHGIEIQLDNKALTDAGIGSDTPVTKNLKEVSLRSALNLLLREWNLTWVIKDEVLLITTPEEAEAMLITKVIDVSDLVVCRNSKGELWDNYDPLIEMITSTVLPTSWDEVGGPGSICPANFGSAKALVISHTYRGHAEIAGVLEKIQAIAKKNPDGRLPLRDQGSSCPRPDGSMQQQPYSPGMGMY